MSAASMRSLPRRSLAITTGLDEVRREFIVAFLLSGTISLVVQSAMLLTPLMMMHVTDGVMRTRNLATLYVLGLVILTAMVLSGLLRYFRSAILGVAAERIGRRLQLRALTASVHVAMGGDRLRPMLALSDLGEFRRLLGGGFASDLFDLLVVPVALVFLWALHPALLVTALVLMVLQLSLAVMAARAGRGVAQQASLASARSSNDLQSWLAQRDTVQGLGLLPAVLRRWAPVWLASVDCRDQAAARSTALHSLVGLIGYTQQIAVIAVGAWLVVNDELTPGGKLAAMMMVNLTTAPLLAVLSRWQDWTHGLVAWRRLSDLVETAMPPAAEPADPTVPPGLVFRDVTVRPSGTDRDLVQHLDLCLAPGEAWALVGPNGIGKTTLLRAAIGLAQPVTGRVLLDGQDTWHADRAEIGARIGYLPQEAMLLDGSVVENIGRFGEKPASGAAAAARLVGAHELIGRLHRGYDSPAGPQAGLSGGQQRLVGLARAFYGKPRLLVLDEPEAGLDAPLRQSLQDAVMAAKADGAIILLVTHDPAPWRGVVDRTLRLKGGGSWEASPVVKEDSRCTA